MVNVEGREPIDISFVNEPDYKMIGTQSVEIKLTDVKGRESVVTAYLHVTPVKQELTLSASKEPADVKEFLNVTKDVIAVFSDGRIAEYGTHAELENIPGGIYAKMFEAQAKYYKD